MPERLTDYPYPAAPPPCQQEGPAQGQPCEGCPFLPDCDYQRIGKLLVDGREELRGAYTDEVIPGFLTLSGLRRLIETELGEELAQGNWGLVYGDPRGVKVFNDVFSRGDGDNLLVVSGSRMEGVARLGRRNLEQSDRAEQAVERRPGSPERDYAFRGRQSDDMGVLIRNVDAWRLGGITNRVSGDFSVEAAVRHNLAGRIPVMASVVWIHAEEVPQHLLEKPSRAFNAMLDVADGRHLVVKSQQYVEMFQLARVAAAERGVTLVRDDLTDERKIILWFYQYCCPEFWANAAERMQNAADAARLARE
jgi:hypothetical protein